MVFVENHHSLSEDQIRILREKYGNIVWGNGDFKRDELNRKAQDAKSLNEIKDKLEKNMTLVNFAAGKK